MKQIHKVAILDLDSILFSIGNPNKVLDENNEPLKKDGKFVYEDKSLDELVESADFIMNKILTNCKCTHYIAYIKGKDTVKNKRLIDPNYKMDRPKESPKWWDFVKGYLINSWKAVESHEIEVDDSCNIARLQIENSFMVCIDSDLLGLEGTHYKWRTKGDLKGEWVTTSNEYATYKFWSDMIIGTHNNTKGIPGKGQAYVDKSFKCLENTKFHTCVFNNYLDYFGEEEGITQFYKNYKMIKVLDKYEGFQLPGLTEFKNEKTNNISEEKGIFE